MSKQTEKKKLKVTAEQFKDRTYFDFGHLSIRQLVGVVIIFSVLIVTFILTICSASQMGSAYNYREDYSSYGEGWDVTYYSTTGGIDRSAGEADINEVYKFSPTENERTIIFSKYIDPSDIPNADDYDTYLVFYLYSKDLSVNVFVDMDGNGSFIDPDDITATYNYESPEIAQNTSASAWLFIELPKDIGGHMVYIETSCLVGTTAIPYVYGMTIGQASAIYHHIYNLSIFRFIIGFVMFVLCLVTALLSFTLTKLRSPQLIFFSLFGLFTSVFIMVESDFLQLVTNNIFLWSFAKTISLGFSCLFLASYIYIKAGNMVMLNLGRVLMWLSLILMPTILILSFLPTIDTSEFVPYMEGIYIIVALFALINFIILGKIDYRQRLSVVIPILIFSSLIIESILLYFGMKQFETYFLGLGVLISVLISVMIEYSFNVLGSSHLLRQQQTEQDQKVAIMLAQIQPHFLYNSLNSIAILCDINPRQAHDLTLKFSQYLRNNIDALSQQTPILFSTELKNIKNYLEIEKVRFSNKLNVVENIQVSDFFVPVLTVQPIVENAVKHGVSKRSTPGVVMISTSQDMNNFYIMIEDNGVGFDPTILEKNEKLGKSIGLTNVKYRLKSIMNADLEIISEIGKGTKVTINLPKVTNSSSRG